MVLIGHPSVRPGRHRRRVPRGALVVRGLDRHVLDGTDRGTGPVLHPDHQLERTGRRPPWSSNSASNRTTCTAARWAPRQGRARTGTSPGPLLGGRPVSRLRSGCRTAWSAEVSWVDVVTEPPVIGSWGRGRWRVQQQRGDGGHGAEVAMGVEVADPQDEVAGTGVDVGLELPGAVLRMAVDDGLERAQVVEASAVVGGEVTVERGRSGRRGTGQDGRGRGRASRPPRLGRRRPAPTGAGPGRGGRPPGSGGTGPPVEQLSGERQPGGSSAGVPEGRAARPGGFG